MESGDDDVKLDKIGSDLARGILYNYVRLNYIEVTPDKSRDDLMREAGMLALEHLHRFSEENPGEDIEMGVNMMPDLLESARLVTDEASKIILVAAWIEHWINGTICFTMLEKGLPHHCFQVLSRKLGPTDKFEALWPLLDLEEMPEEVPRMIQRIIELRNRYIHYKWPTYDSDRRGAMFNELKNGAELADRMIRKILEYEDVHFHGGRAAELYGDDFYNFDEQ